MRSVAFAVALLISTTVFAGTVTVQDDTNLFRALGQVESKAGDWPFDTRIVISDRAPNKSAFESQVSNQVVGPRVLAIGISPAHKFTVVRFGKGLHIPDSVWSRISSSGNSAFKVGEYGLGIINIAETVKENMVQVTERPTYTTVTKSYTVEPEPVHPAWFVVPIGLVLFLALLIGLVIRKRAKERAQQERLRLAEEAADHIIAADLSRPVERITPSGNHYQYTPSDFNPYKPQISRVNYNGEPVYRNPPTTIVSTPVVQPPPVVVHDSGNSLVTGMLLNEALHSHHDHYEPEHHHVEREVVREVVHETPSSSGSSSTWDSTPTVSSGSSSSWSSSSDDSSGSSSSWSNSSSDSGSSSSWDSGSSSDSGSSGGSSDW